MIIDIKKIDIKKKQNIVKKFFSSKISKEVGFIDFMKIT